MNRGERLRYRIAVHYESNHFVEADSPDEAVRLWQHEMHMDHVPYKIQKKEWIKGGFRLVVELQEHLSQKNRDTLGESISIGNISKSGENIT